jgi:hypothetical protein
MTNSKLLWSFNYNSVFLAQRSHTNILDNDSSGIVDCQDEGSSTLNEY